MLAIIVFVIVNAQQTANINPQKLKLFFEKAYLHLDKTFYVAGDDIWYRAYLVNAQNNAPIYTSNNLYVELISTNATLIEKQLIRLDNGLGKGDFKLPDTLKTGIYRIRAYTNWMRNFGDNFIFEKQITIGSKLTENLPTTKVTKSTNTIQNITTNQTDDARMQFFPEGGSLIVGVTSIVAFKAEDANGKGILVQGTIVDSKSKIIASFKSNNLGMGSLQITPIDGEVYDVKTTTLTNKTIISYLPIPLARGITISSKNLDSATLEIRIKTNKATLLALQNQLLTIEIKHTGKKYIEDSVRLTAEELVIKLPTFILPEGVAIITLLDEKRRPNSERLIYIDRSYMTNFSMSINNKIAALQDNTIVNINILNAIGKPLKANLSMAVVDGTIVPTQKTNIVSYLLLQSELKGDIENADKYFDKSNPNRLQQLDVLLLTQGWRDFIWPRLAQQGITIKYLPEAGITVSGLVKKAGSEKPLGSIANITLRAPQANGNKLFLTQTDSSGRYYFDGLDMMGVQKLRLTAKDGKGKNIGVISVDELFKNPLPIKALPINEQMVDTSLAFKIFTLEANSRASELNKIKLAEISELPGVTVISRKEKIKLLSDGMAMDAGYKDSIFTPDAIDIKLYETLENYLFHKINGAIVDVDSGGVYFGGLGKVRPRFIVDNREDLFETLDFFRLTVNVISKIVVQHLVSATDPTRDIYIINLTLKPEANQQQNPNIINTQVNGYYQARQFYIPQPKATITNNSFLTTQFWMPDVETVNGNAKVVISNKNISTKWSIIVEGITETGNPIYGIVNYEVKK